MALRVGRRIAQLFRDHGTRRRRVVSITSRPYFTPGKDPVPIAQKVGWAPGPVWTGGKSRPTGIRSPDSPVRSSVAIPTELPGPLCRPGKKQKTVHGRHQSPNFCLRTLAVRIEYYSTTTLFTILLHHLYGSTHLCINSVRKL